MSTLETNLIQPATGTTLTVGASGDQITAATGVKTSFLYPAFEASLSAQQTVSDATATKAECNTENFDTDGAYDNSTNYRFTPQVAGKYYVYGSVATNATSSYLQQTKSLIYKNGSEVKQSRLYNSDGFHMANTVPVVAIVDMNGSTDYLELFGFADNTSGSPIFQDTQTYFGSYRIGT
jgi:ribosomal protein L9